jgi:hypothetical protein
VALTSLVEDPAQALADLGPEAAKLEERWPRSSRNNSFFAIEIGKSLE